MPNRVVMGTLADGTCYFAPLGHLPTSGDRVCCHLCGRWFLSVASHLRVHGWTKAGYLEAFGLERTNGLRGEATRKRRAVAMTGRQAVEPAIREAQHRARQRARSGALATAAADAARGRHHPIERRRKTLAALDRIDPARQRAANVARGQDRIRTTAAAVAERFGFATFADYTTDRTERGRSLAAISREAGQHKDWLARHLAALAPDLAATRRDAVLDARWAAVVGDRDLRSYLYREHVVRHRTVTSIATTTGFSRDTVAAALRRHGITVSAHAGVRHRAAARDESAARALGYPTLHDYVRDRRAHGAPWSALAAESGIPETSLRRRAARPAGGAERSQVVPAQNG